MTCKTKFSIIKTNCFNFLFQLEKLVSSNYFLQVSAREAFKNYVRAYKSHHMKRVFDVNTLDLAAVSKSLGLPVPPFVSI